jgi:hypothetical protein
MKTGPDPVDHHIGAGLDQTLLISDLEQTESGRCKRPEHQDGDEDSADHISSHVSDSFRIRD